MFKHFLHHIVSENVHGQRKNFGYNFLINTFLFVAVGGLQPLLKKSRAILVTAKLYNMAIRLLYSLITSSVNAEVGVIRIP